MDKTRQFCLVRVGGVTWALVNSFVKMDTGVSGYSVHVHTICLVTLVMQLNLSNKQLN